MNKLFFIVAIILINFKTTAQIEPFVKTKTGEQVKFEKVKFNWIKTKVIGIDGDKKQKFKKKELESVLLGPSKLKVNNYLHVVFLKLKGVGLGSKNGTWELGKRPYQIMIKSGENMIISTSTSYYSAPTYGPTMGGGMMGQTTGGTSGSSTQYYFIEGEKVIFLFGDWFKDEFIKKLISAFGGCPEAKELLIKYSESKGKLFKLYGMMRDLKRVYIEDCLENE